MRTSTAIALALGAALSVTCELPGPDPRPRAIRADARTAPRPPEGRQQPTDASRGARPARRPDAAPHARARPPSTPRRPEDLASARALLRQRPYVLGVPDGIDTSAPVPLVLFLHGYGASGRRLMEILDVATVARERGFAYAVPDGTRGPDGRRFWNATGACCNFYDLHVDDVAYLRAVLRDALDRAPVDPQRVYIFGFSNGGFMAHRLACEASELITGIASVAGVADIDPAVCTPSRAVSVLQVHGDADDIVRFQGGHTLHRDDRPPHPSAMTTVSEWASRNGCATAPTERPPIDLEPRLPGAETTIFRFDGCREGSVELWRVRGGSHFVALRAGAVARVLEALVPSGDGARTP